MAWHGWALFEKAFLGIWQHCIMDGLGCVGLASSNETLLFLQRAVVLRFYRGMQFFFCYVKSDTH